MYILDIWSLRKRVTRIAERTISWPRIAYVKLVFFDQSTELQFSESWGLPIFTEDFA